MIVVSFAAMTAAAVLAAAWTGRTRLVGPNWSAVLGTLALAVLKDPGPIGEEFGWRGFALPRLLERYSPISTSLRLGLVHSAWHLPLFFIPGMPQTLVSFPLFSLGVVSIAVFDTMLYLRTGANLLLAILVHLLANVCGGFAAQAHALGFFFGAEAVVAGVVVVTGGFSGSPYSHVNRGPRAGTSDLRAG